MNNRFRDEMDARIAKILDKGWYLQGEENEVFSRHFADYCGAKYALGVANGLDALRLIIKTSGFGEGSGMNRIGKVLMKIRSEIQNKVPSWFDPTQKMSHF